MIDMELTNDLFHFIERFIVYGRSRANFVEDILFNFSSSLILNLDDKDDISFPLSKSQIDFEELLLTSSSNRRWQRILIYKPKVGIDLFTVFSEVPELFIITAVSQKFIHSTFDLCDCVRMLGKVIISRRWRTPFLSL